MSIVECCLSKGPAGAPAGKQKTSRPLRPAAADDTAATKRSIALAVRAQVCSTVNELPQNLSAELPSALPPKPAAKDSQLDRCQTAFQPESTTAKQLVVEMRLTPHGPIIPFSTGLATGIVSGLMRDVFERPRKLTSSIRLSSVESVSPEGVSSRTYWSMYAEAVPPPPPNPPPTPICVGRGRIVAVM